MRVGGGARSPHVPGRTTSDRVPRRPTIPSLHRIPAALISLAVLAGSGLVPAVASPTEQPATTAHGEELVLGAEHVEAVRARVEQLRAERPATQAGFTAHAATVNPVVTRHHGSDRYATAASIANTWYRDYFWDGSRSPFPKEFEKIAFVASGTTFADALSGGAAAAAWGGPLLLTRPGALPTATRLSLAGLRPDAIVVLGGASAVSDTVVQELQAYVPAPDNVTRISSADRYGVSALTARLIGRAPVAFVANGTTFADGLAGGAAAGSAVSPLLLTRRDSVPGGVMSVLTTTTRPQRIYVLGGTGAVSDAVVRQLEAVAPVTRVDGSDRYVVAARVAAIHPTNYGATVASGETWPDALAATAFAGLMGDKLLLLRGANAPGATTTAIVQHQLVAIDAFGGPGVVQESVLTTLRRLRVPSPEAG